MNMQPHWSEVVVASGLAGLKRLSGYYHENFVAQQQGESYVIRITRDQWDDMDFRMFDEKVILRHLEPHAFPAPRLVYFSPTQNYSVHSFVDGTPLNALYPKHKTLSPAFIDGMAGLMARVHSLPTEGLAAEAVPTAPTDANDFLRMLLAYVRRFYQWAWTEAPDAFAEMDFPADPFGCFMPLVGKMTNRPLVLCHADVHQHNIMVAADGHDMALLDWELAVLGDRLYDLSLSASRSYMQPPQIDLLMSAYIKLLPKEIDALQLRAELGTYLGIEYIRKAISDIYRLSHAMQRAGSGDDQDIRYKREVRLPDLMAKARAYWHDGSVL